MDNNCSLIRRPSSHTEVIWRMFHCLRILWSTGIFGARTVIVEDPTAASGLRRRSRYQSQHTANIRCCSTKSEVSDVSRVLKRSVKIQKLRRAMRI